MTSEELNERCENCIVRKTNVLQAMSKNELKQVSNAKISKSLKKGDILFKEGECLNGVFCIRSGATKLSKLSTSGNNQIIKIAGKGKIIGKRVIIAHEKMHMQATALSDMQVCFIPKNKIIEPFKKNNKFNLEVFKSFTSELKEADNVIMNRSQKSAQQRLAHILLDLKNTYGLDDSGFLKLKITREDLASLIGTVKESCVRNMTVLKKKNYIKLDGQSIAILDEKALKKIIKGKRYRN